MPTFHYTPLHSHIIPRIGYVPSGKWLEYYDISVELDKQLGGKWLIYKFKHNIVHQNGLNFKTYQLYLDNCCNLWKIREDLQYRCNKPAVSIEFVTLNNYHWFESNPSIYDTECKHIPLNDKLINEIVIALDNTNQYIPPSGDNNSRLKLPNKEFFDIYINRAKQYAEFIDKNYRRLDFLHLEDEDSHNGYGSGYYKPWSDWDEKCNNTMYRINLDLISDNEVKSKLLKEFEEDMNDGLGNEDTFLERYDVTAEFLITNFPELLKLYDTMANHMDCGFTSNTPEKVRKKYNLKWCDCSDHHN
jgi:hypothetical protein